MDRSPSLHSPRPAPTLRVRVDSTATDRQPYRFYTRFRIGRAADCEVRIDDQRISRYHAEGLFYQGQWWIRDLQSSNGILVAGHRVDAVPVRGEITVQLGFDGPSIKKWQSSGRFARDIQTANAKGCTPKIVEELLAAVCRPQFYRRELYLNLVSSDELKKVA